MNFHFKPQYDFEMLSFLNILTGDPFYTAPNMESYERFAPLLSGTSKGNMQMLVDGFGRTNLAFPFCLMYANMPQDQALSVLEAFQRRELVEPVVAALRGLPYIPSEVLSRFDELLGAAVAVMKDLESLGFHRYWHQEKKPALDARCAALAAFAEAHDFRELFSTLKPTLPASVNVYICTFHRPHGTKLTQTDDALILSDDYSDEHALTTLIHELFHPPYAQEAAEPALDLLAAKPWVMRAFDEQHPNCRYGQMAYFLEENIVEALGVYVAHEIGVEKRPYAYFRQHDYGSHVVSPYFYRYLLEHPKARDTSFEAYLLAFACALDASGPASYEDLA